MSTFKKGSKDDSSASPSGLSFLTRPSTFVVTAIRLALILVVPFVSDNTILPSWLHSSPSLLSVLVRPSQTLVHLKEAHAIRGLAAAPRVVNDFSKAYLGASIRIPPLVLAALSPLLETQYPELWLSLLLLVVDFVIACLLEQIGRSLLLSEKCPRIAKEEQRQNVLPAVIQPEFAHIFPIYTTTNDHNDDHSKKSAIFTMSSLPLMAAQLYYASPFTAMPSCLYQSWQNLPTLFCLASIFLACSDRHRSFTLSTFLLAMAAYMEPFYLVMSIPAVILFAYGMQRDDKAISFGPAARAFLGLLILWTLCFGYLTYALVGSSSDMFGKVLWDVYGETCWLTTSPNLSLQWYFRMQLFARFRDYFGAIFLGLPFVLIVPLSIRLWRYPEVLMACFAFIWCIYRPVQVLQDANVAFCLMLFNPRSMARMGIPSFIALCSIMVPVLLNIVDHWMWLERNNGNANYMFFQCLAYNAFLGIILGQLTSASAQRDKATRIDLNEHATRGDKEKKE